MYMSLLIDFIFSYVRSFVNTTLENYINSEIIHIHVYMYLHEGK